MIKLSAAPGYVNSRPETRLVAGQSISSTGVRCGFFPALGFAVLLATSPAVLAQAVPDLGEAFGFLVLSATPSTGGAVTCTTSTINGSLGSTGGLSDTECSYNGPVTQALPDSPVVNDFNSAYSDFDTENTCSTLNGTLAGAAPVAGVYCLDSSDKTGNLTLSGNADDIWIFKSPGSGGLTGTNFNVVMGGSADACNVYWWSEMAATMTDSNFKGTILAGEDITVTRDTLEGRALAAGAVTVTDAILSFAGCAAPATITVAKSFSDSNTDAVQVALSCTSGTVMNSPLNASASAPAVFTVAVADPGTLCTATETVPTGYTANQADCVDVELGGSCTISNTAIPAGPATVTVNKDFSDNSDATVSIGLVCTSGSVSSTPLPAAEGAPAIFTVTGALAGASCTATETVPAGYTANQTGCVGVEPGGSCTIINTVVPVGAETVTVNKNFSDNSTALVSIGLVCTSGSVTSTPLTAAEGAPAMFTVSEALPGASCTATETVPAGYVADQGECQAVSLGGACTITNRLVVMAGVTPIPTFSQWATLLLTGLLALFGFLGFKRHTGLRLDS